MKLLAKYNTVVDAEDAALSLRAQGIVTHVGSQIGVTLNGLLHGVTEVSLWVVLDEQYQDAVSYLENPNHEVTTGLKDQEMEEFLQAGTENIFKQMNYAILLGVILILIISCILYWMSGDV